MTIATEIFGTTMRKYAEGFTILLPSLGAIIGYLLSFVFLALTLKTMSLSIAYSVWAGAGKALMALVGWMIGAESLGLLKVAAILLIIAGVVILNFSKQDEEVVKAD